jgi:hypothetical protein
MYWIGWVVERGDPISSASDNSAVGLQIAYRIPNDGNTVVDDLFAGLSELAVPTCLCRQIDNHGSG